MLHQASLPSNNWRHRLWLTLLVAASVAFSLGLACAVPLAAFAAAAMLTLSRRTALLLVGAVWLANQLVGYGLLHYTCNGNSFAWGGALGAVALLATEAARAIAPRVRQSGPLMGPLMSFFAAFVVYEVALFLIAVTLLGGMDAFAPAIIGRIFLINAVAMVGLLALNRLAIAGGFIAAPNLSLSMIEPHAQECGSAPGPLLGNDKCLGRCWKAIRLRNNVAIHYDALVKIAVGNLTQGVRANRSMGGTIGPVTGSGDCILLESSE